MAELEPLGIKRVQYVHFFVRDLVRTRDHYVQRLDFAVVATSDAAYEEARRERAVLLEAGDVRFLVSEPLGVSGEAHRFLVGGCVGARLRGLRYFWPSGSFEGFSHCLR